MGRTIIPDDPGPRMARVQIIAFVFLLAIGAGLYWVHDLTNYGYSLKPDFMLSQVDQEFREMDRYFDEIKDRFERSGDREAAKKEARIFEREFASRSRHLTSSGATRRAEKLLRELHRFQERVN